MAGNTYVVLEEGGVNYAPPATKTVYYTSNNSRRNKACASGCCCFLVLLFFLLFFLIPRDPEVSINSITLTGNPNTLITVTGNFEFINRNFYKMEYNQLLVNVGTFGTTNAAYGVGNYTSTIDLGIRQSTSVNIDIVPSSLGSLGLLYTQACPASYITISGTVDATTNGAVHKDFGTVSLLPENIMIYCN